MSILLHVFERNAWQIFAQFLTFPPRTCFAMFLRYRETVAVKSCANVTWRILRKRIPFKKRCDLRFAVQQGNHRLNKPRVLSIRPERGEPHLPVEPRLMRCTPTRRAVYAARLPFELVRLPINSVGAALDHNLAPVFRHHAKKTVAVYDSERFRSRINGSEQARPFRFRFERAVNQPHIERQSENNYRSRRTMRQSMSKIMGHDGACPSICLEGT